jgi:preprotein translocase SecE subunit
MAVIKTKEDSLVETKIVDDKIKVKSTDIKENIDSITTGKNFFATTLEELRKVEWSKPKYVFNWSLVIILFTAVFSISLGLVDNVFDAGLKFVDCTSVLPKTGEAEKNSILGNCSKDFLQNATYQK